MIKFFKHLPFIALGAFSLTACSVGGDAGDTDTASDFLKALSPLCGKTYIGAVVSDDPQDEDWRQEVLTLGPIECSEGDVIAMPLAVGADTSRTWFLKPAGDKIEFRHQHLLKNGDVDPVSDYGGYSNEFSKTTAETHIDDKLTQQKTLWFIDFPADEKTIAIFNKNGLEVSTTNVWSFEYNEGVQLSYELNRQGRHFRAEFDLAPPS